MATDAVLSEVAKTVGFGTIVNWTSVSKLPLSESQIDALAEKLDWTVLASTAPLTPEIISKHIDRIDFQLLSSNSNLPSESVRIYMDKFDSELSQRYHRYTDEMVIKLLSDGVAECLILLTYQKLQYNTIEALFAHYVPQWNVIRQMADCALQHQVLPIHTLEYLMSLESSETLETPESPNNDSNVQKKVLFDRGMALHYQPALPVDWIQERLATTLETRQLLLANYVLPEADALKIIITSPSDFDMRKILKKQRFQEAVLQFCLELQPDQSIKTLMFIARYQMFDIAFLRSQIERLGITGEQKSNLYNTVFLRTLKPSSANFLAWNDVDIKDLVMPNISVPDMIVQPIDHIPEFIQAIHDRDLEIDWYRFLCQQNVDQAAIDEIRKHVNPLVLWFAISRLSRKEAAAMKWWHEMTPVQIMTLVDSVESQDPNSMTEFLEEFVSVTNWSALLNNEALPEWFITIFAKYASAIEARQNKISYWWKIARYQKLTSTFIDAHLDKFDIRTLLTYQVLTALQMSNLEASGIMTQEDRDLARARQPWAVTSK